MRIVSANTGNPRSLVWKGKLIQTGIFNYPAIQPIYPGREDIENDTLIDRKYHSGFDKTCYLYSADHNPFWHRLYPELEMAWGIFGENLTVGGFHEYDTYIGDILQIGEASVQATQPHVIR